MAGFSISYEILIRFYKAFVNLMIHPGIHLLERFFVNMFLQLGLDLPTKYCNESNENGEKWSILYKQYYQKKRLTFFNSCNLFGRWVFPEFLMKHNI